MLVYFKNRGREGNTLNQVISERRRVSSAGVEECVNQQQHRRWDIMAVRWVKKRTRGRSRRTFTRRPGMTWREETALVHFHREYSRKEIYHESVSSSCAVDPLLRHRWVEFLSIYASRPDYAFLDHFRTEINPFISNSFEFFLFFFFFVQSSNGATDLSQLFALYRYIDLIDNSQHVKMR